MKVEVTGYEVRHNGKTYKRGDIIPNNQLGKEAGQRLIELGVAIRCNNEDENNQDNTPPEDSPMNTNEGETTSGESDNTTPSNEPKETQVSDGEEE